MSNATPERLFSDDAAKTELYHDKLGIRPFAKRLADILIRLPAPNGYVIGLHSGWGSGKTTALNFVKRYVEKHNVERAGNDPALLWLEFKPWMTSGHRDLTSAFFKVLAEQIDAQASGWWQRLRRGRAASDAVFDNLDKLSLLTGPLHGLKLTAGFKIAKSGYNALVDAQAEEPSLQKVHDRLADALRKSDRKLLVVIDDLDRLRKDEILQMMMMVKTVGQLPNIVYLLTYDQKIVWDALADAKPTSGDEPSYAEKIIQQEVALPVPTLDRLLGLFEAQTEFLMVPASAQDRWTVVIVHGLRRWLRTPRDVSQFTNNLRFAWPSVAEYLDPVDYIAIEGLRTFDRGAFAFIRDNREFLFPWLSGTMRRDREVIESIEQFRAAVPDAVLRPVTEIAVLLFPYRTTAFEHSDEEKKEGKLKPSYGHEDEAAIRRRRGLAFLESYDSYFRLYPPNHLVKRSDVDVFMDRMDDEPWLFEALKKAQDSIRPDFMTLTADLIRDVDDRIQQPNVFRSTRQPIVSVALLRALTRVFDARLRPTPPRRGLSSLEHLFMTVLGDLHEKAATDAMLQLFSVDVGLGTGAHLTREILVRMGMMPGAQTHYELIGTENGERLARAVIDRIKVERDAGTLATAAPMMDMLELWERYEGETAPRDWLANNLDDRTLMLELANMFVFKEGIHPWRAYHRSANDAEDTMRFFQSESLHDAVFNLSQDPSLSDEQSSMVRAWHKTFEKERSMSSDAQ